ncbi:hypothetical protein CsSME_00031885 [Camellia sinensis var. sinensis]
MSVSPYFSHRHCTSAVEEMIKTEIRKVETEYFHYTTEQKRIDSLIHRALTTTAYHRPPTQAESYESCYQGPGDNQPMDME